MLDRIFDVDRPNRARLQDGEGCKTKMTRGYLDIQMAQRVCSVEQAPFSRVTGVSLVDVGGVSLSR
jgi:hypothetical protein